MLSREMTVPAGLQDTFALFEDPGNLARITPPSLGFRITSPRPVEMRRGAEIRYCIRVAGIPLRWATVITGYEPPFHFTDVQAKGPYRVWRHTHSFQPSVQGTIMRDRVEYALPFGPLGRLVHALFVRRQLQRIFEYRRQAMSRLFSDATPWEAR